MSNVLDRFINGTLVVKLNGLDEIKEFLELVQNNTSLVWLNGVKPTEFIPDERSCIQNSELGMHWHCQEYMTTFDLDMSISYEDFMREYNSTVGGDDVINTSIKIILMEKLLELYNERPHIHGSVEKIVDDYIADLEQQLKKVL